MMADEATGDEMQKLGAPWTLNNSAWQWSRRQPSGQGVPALFWGDDWVTLRHSGRGTVVNADGHVEVVKTNYWADVRHCDPTFGE